MMTAEKNTNVWRRLIGVLLLGVVGYGALIVLFTRYDAVADLGIEIDRAQAIARASEIAGELNQEVSGWRKHATVRRSSPTDLELQQTIVRLGRQLPVLPVVTTHVVFEDPGAEQNVTIDLDPMGRLVALDLPCATHVETSDLVAVRRSVEKIISVNTGLDTPQLQEVPPGPDDRATPALRWRWSDVDVPEVSIDVNAAACGSSVQSLRLQPSWDQHLLDGANEVWGLHADGVKIAAIIFAFLACCVAFMPLGVAVARRSAPLRSMAALALVLFILPVFGVFVSRGFPGLKEILLMVFGFGLFAFASAEMWGAGFMATRRTWPEKMLAFELLFSGRGGARVVGLEFAAGLLLGGLLAATPYAVGLIIRGPGMVMSLLNPNRLGRGSPVLESFGGVAIGCLFPLLIFAFVRPVVHDQLTSRWSARFISWICGVVVLSRVVPLDQLSIVLVTACIWLVILELVYRHFGLLAVVVAWASSVISINAAGLLSQPADGLRQSGLILVGLGISLVVVGLLVALKGRNLGVEALPPVVETKAKREQSRAELEVARDAQMKMLPDSPPEIVGYDVAAVCRPARDVGGDLFDFGTMTSGLPGIAVANAGIAVGDVSGKGMAAALYMTLARGLLAAASEERSDPREILCGVNRDYYEMVPKNVFVTMVLATLEPESRRLRFARAGHTPLVWRRARRGETLLLTPSGLAVGLAGPSVFNQVLEAQDIQLEPGDGVFFASDGISEAMNSQRQEYGDERFKWIVDQTDGLSAEQARDKVLADVAAFCGKAPAHDDVTLVVLRVLAESDQPQES